MDTQQPTTEQRLALLREMSRSLAPDRRRAELLRIARNHPDLRAECEKLLGEKLADPAPIFAHVHIVEEQPRTLAIDPEAARILDALGYSWGVFAYFVALDMTRQIGGGGIDENALINRLMSLTGKSRRTVRRWLDKHHTKLWDWHKPTHKLYIRAIAKLKKRGMSGRLNPVQLALDAGKPGLVETNRPGAREIIVELPDRLTLKLWRALINIAWHNSRGEQTELISRATKRQLFGASRMTQLSREKAYNEQKRAGAPGIETRRNYAQYRSIHAAPRHATPYVAYIDGRQQVRAIARRPNAYTVPPLKERQNKRISGERRRAASATLETWKNEAETCDPCRVYGAPAEAGAGFNRTGRLNFFDADGDTRRAFKRCRSHLRRHGDHDRPHFVRIGERRLKYGTVGIYEHYTGTQQTTTDERLRRIDEDAYFGRNGGRASYAALFREAV